MSSKQILHLPTILEDSEKMVNDYQIKEECRKKAIIYELKQKQWKTQIQLSKISKELQDHVISNAAAKLALVDSLVPLLKKQSTIFKADRITTCTKIYQHLAELDKMPADTEKLATHANELSSKIDEYIRQIAYLETGSNIHF
jgi:hypothetical protein